MIETGWRSEIEITPAMVEAALLSASVDHRPHWCNRGEWLCSVDGVFDLNAVSETLSQMLSKPSS